ncbi:MAG: YkgJ family cysteine cluster protein [Oligoflexus sp.]|jgi:hypothetical protein
MSGIPRRNTGDGLAKKGRSCGTCTLCCTYLEIESKPGFSTRLDTGEDLAKPSGISCPYLGPRGCTIYDARPLVCRQFACDWLMGQKGFGPEDSPLRTGVIGVRGVNWHYTKPITPRSA